MSDGRGFMPALDLQWERFGSGWKALGGEKKRVRIHEIHGLMEDPHFFDDRAAAQKLTKELKLINARLRDWIEIEKELKALLDLRACLEDDHDPEFEEEIQRNTQGAAKKLDSLEIQLHLGGPYDLNPCYLQISSGAGGTEAADWAEMMLRMYSRFCERRNWRYSILQQRDGEEAGISSVTVEIIGDYAYGYLRSERGVHRLVRVSPFDGGGRRHTSFAAVDVVPRIEDTDLIEIHERDIRIDTFRAQGAGGQHINKTDSAVRITHIPTGIVATCQNERSQHKNRDHALKILKSRLIQRKEEERQKERQIREAEKMDNSFGSQIRNYVLYPYTLVRDIRTGCETSNTSAVLDGDLDEIIQSVLKWREAHDGL